MRVEGRCSYLAIANKLDVAKSTLSGWLKEFPLTKDEILKLRQQNWKKNEAKIERFRATMKEKRELREREVYSKYFDKFKTLSRDSFFVAGLMLYLAEGAKTDPYNIALANTDPSVHVFFIKWLRLFMDIPSSKLRFHLHLYENMDVDKEINFWEKQIKLDKSQMYKPYMHKMRSSSFSYRGASRHGTCKVVVCSVEKKTELMMAIRAYLDRISGLGD